MDKRVTGHVLRYLLENRFGSKAEMARQLGVQQRTLEKVLVNLELAKAGTIAFDKAIHYCAQNHISLDSILEDFVRDTEVSTGAVNADQQAYTRLALNKPHDLTAEGEDTFASMLSFMRQASAYVCPNCRTWCNPWDGKHSAERMDCYIGHIAREIVKDVAEFYTKEHETK